MKNQFETLSPWLPQILQTLKREIKAEHLSKNPSFYRTYFGTRPQNRLTSEEISLAYEKELLQGNEELTEWVINRWVFNHGEIYRYFAEQLSQIHTDFDEIKNLNEGQSEAILSGALTSFGALPTYLFSVLNRVVFPEAVLQRLREKAEQEEKVQKTEAAALGEKQALDQVIAHHEREMSRLQEKCEQKIAGAMKKYTTDIHALKQQIRALQQRLNSQ